MGRCLQELERHRLQQSHRISETGLQTLCLVSGSTRMAVAGFSALRHHMCAWCWPGDFHRARTFFLILYFLLSVIRLDLLPLLFFGMVPGCLSHKSWEIELLACNVNIRLLKSAPAPDLFDGCCTTGAPQTQRKHLPAVIWRLQTTTDC